MRVSPFVMRVSACGLCAAHACAGELSCLRARGASLAARPPQTRVGSCCTFSSVGSTGHMREKSAQSTAHPRIEPASVPKLCQDDGWQCGARTRTHTHIHTQIHIGTHTHGQTHPCTDMHTHFRSCTRTRTQIHTGTCTHAHAHGQTHPRTNN